MPAQEATDADGSNIAADHDDPATTATSTLDIPVAANDNEPVAGDESEPEVQADAVPANDNSPLPTAEAI